MKKIDVLILAGGQSRRMQQNKALLKVNEQTLIEHLIAQFPQALLNNLYIAGNKSELPKIDKAIYLDDFLSQQYQGPLSGIAQTLSESSAEYVWVLSCDILHLPDNTLQQLIQCAENTQASIVYAQSAAKNDYPLIALWHTSLAQALAEYLLNGERRVMKFLQQQNSVACELLALDDRLCNINTPEEFSQALNVFKQKIS